MEMATIPTSQLIPPEKPTLGKYMDSFLVLGAPSVESVTPVQVQVCSPLNSKCNAIHHKNRIRDWADQWLVKVVHQSLKISVLQTLF